MSLKSTEWFIDTFPSIIGLTADQDPSYAETELDSDLTSSSTTSKLLQEECSGDERLANMCEKFCQVNRCKYTSGLATIVSPMAGILAEDSARIPAHLVAVFNFRDRFCVVPPAGQDKSYSGRIKSVLGSGPTRTELQDLVTFGLLVGLIRYHRPNCASVLDTVFGTNQLPVQIWNWLRSAFVSCCDGAGTAREVMASIAATGQAATVALLLVAAIEEVVGSLPVNSAEAIEEAVDSFVVSPEKLESLWQAATEMAKATPISFQHDFALHATAHGRKKIKANEADVDDELVVQIRETPLGLLSLPAEDVVRELQKAFTASTRPVSPVNDSADQSAMFSIGEEMSETATSMRLVCIAGTSIENSLRTFVSVADQRLSPRSPKSRTSVFVDARTAEERDMDDTTAVATSHQIEKRHKEESGEDWFHDPQTPNSPEREASSCESDERRLIVKRFKQALWVDSDLHFETVTNDLSSAENIFMKKLEFYRGQRLCVIGNGSSAKSLLNLLLLREFPCVCTARGGFAAVRASLLACDSETIDELAIITQPVVAEPVEVTRSSSVSQRGSAMISGFQSAWKGQKQQLTSYMQSIDTKDMKARFSSFFKSSKSTAPASAPIAVAPAPVSAAVPIVIPKTSGGDAIFEIGEEEDEYDFSSVDLSPKNTSNQN